MKLADLVGKLEPELFEGRKQFKTDSHILDALIDAYLKSMTKTCDEGKTYSCSDIDFAFSALKKFNDLDPAYPQMVYERLHPDKSVICKGYLTSFLAAMCTKSRADTSILLRGQMDQFGQHIAFGKNTITLKGNVACAAYDMRSGTLIIEGSADNAGTCMSGGTLHIKGDVAECGSGLCGGTIHVTGKVGCCAKNPLFGTIYINNNCVYSRKP